jgi:hypothetical protein
MKPYEITVTYHVYAKDKTEATGKVLYHMVEPETVDVYDLPNRQKLEVDLIPY